MVWSTVSVASRLLVTFGIVWVLSRIVELSDFGVATYQYAVAVIASLVIDYGYNLSLSRDLVEPKNRSQLVWRAIYFKTILAVSSLLTSAILVAGSEYWFSFLLLIAAHSLNVVGATLFPYLRARGEFSRESKYVLANNLISAAGFTLMILIGVHGVLAFALSLLLGKTCLCASALWYFLKEYPDRLQTAGAIFSVLRKNFAFFMHAAAGAAYINIDTVLVKEMLGYESVGLYQAAMKVLLAMCVFSDVMNNVFLPAVTRQWNRPGQFANRISNAVIWVSFSLAGLLAALCYYFVLISLMPSVFGSEFVYSPLFALCMAGVLLLRFFGIFPGIVLTVAGHQGARVVGGLLAILALVLSIHFLVPRYGLEGVAMSCLAAHIAVNFVYFGGAIRVLARREEVRKVSSNGHI